MHIEMKQGCGGYTPLWKNEFLYFIKYKNDMHAPAALQKLYRLFGFLTIKIKI